MLPVLILYEYAIKLAEPPKASRLLPAGRSPQIPLAGGAGGSEALAG